MIAENDRNKFKTCQLIIGILQVVLAIWIFKSPSQLSKGVAIVAGLLLIFKGIHQIYIRNILKDNLNIRPNGMVVIGVLDIILGVLILFNLNLSSQVIINSISFYILIRSILGLFTFSPIRLLIPSYHFMSVTVSIIGVLIAIQMLAMPQITEYIIAFITAIYILIDGIQNIVYGFLN